jgi:AcrR family transcriptional regulator
MVHTGGMALQAPTDTRETILDAADGLMQRYGFRKMTMDDIAREAGISKRTIYTHFSSKEEVGLSSIERVVRHAQAQMAEAARQTGTHAARLQAMLVRRVMARVESVREYRQSLDELFEAVRPAYMERRRLSFEREAGMIAEVIREGAEEGAFASGDAATTADLLLRATNAYLPYSLSVAELGDVAKIRKGVSELSRLLIRGLLRDPASEGIS